MAQEKKYDVFISYARKDIDEVRSFVSMLKGHIPSLEVWMDLEGISAADEFDEKIITAIDASSYVLFAMSCNSNSVGEGSSKWTKKELVYAKNTGKKVIPLLLKGASLNSWFLFEFGRTDCIDITSDRQVDKLLKNISQWTKKSLIEPPNVDSLLNHDVQALAIENKKIKYRLDRIKRIYKIIGSVTVTLVTIISLCLLGNHIYRRNMMKNGIEWEIQIMNDSILPYSVQINGFKYKNDYYSDNLTIPRKIEINDTVYSVRSIGEEAFEGCPWLTSITIPNSVTRIGNGAFGSCESLTSITIPNSVMSIGKGTFEGCVKLNCIIIPNSVTSIGEKAFSYCRALTSITIPNSVKSIGDGAFSYSSSLASIIIPNSVMSIGNFAFSYCSGLTSITIPNSVTSIGKGAFEGCVKLNCITIPNSVTSIGRWTFYKCSGLTSITIPNSVTSIGDFAFDGCSGLTSITIPNSVTSIGKRAFASCPRLTSIVVEKGHIKYDSRENCNAIIETATNTLIRGCNSTVIPNSVTSIGDFAFDGCSSLTSISIPNSVTSIGDWAFDGCFSLKSIKIPKGLTNIGSDAFPEHTKVIRE